MKILIVTPYRNFSGGVESVNRMLQSLFEADGHTVDYLTSEGPEHPRNTRIRLMKRVLGLPALTACGYQDLAVGNYDLVLTNGEFGWGIEHPNAICLFHGSYRGLRDHLRRGLSWRHFISLSWQARIQRAAARDKRVVAVSRFVAEILESQGIRVTRVIENCVDTDAFSPAAASAPAGRYLFVGSYHRYAKGFDVLEQLARRGLQIDCVTDQHPGAPLGFLRSVSAGEMPALYRRYRMLIFPSRFEAFGLVPLEAMSCGLPVLMLDVGIGRSLRAQLPEFVIAAGNSTPEELANAFAARIPQIEARYDHYSNAARRYVLSRHSWSHFMQEWRRFAALGTPC